MLSVTQKKSLSRFFITMNNSHQVSPSAEVRMISADTTSGSSSLRTLCRTLYTYRDMCWQLIKRDTAARYKDTFLGLIWPFFQPLITLLVYVFVFGAIFKAPWRGGQEGVAGYALVLFCGFAPWLFFAEVIGNASSIILSRPSFVKKMLFPLEVLPVITVVTALGYAIPPLCILLIGCIVQGVSLSFSLVTLPLLYLPLCLLCLSGAYFLAALGIFVRDVQQIVTAFLQILFFATPIIYPLSTVPAPYKTLIMLNPLSSVVELFRGVILYGQWPDWNIWFMLMAVSIIVLWCGYQLFMRMRKGFADVI